MVTVTIMAVTIAVTIMVGVTIAAGTTGNSNGDAVYRHARRYIREGSVSRDNAAGAVGL